MKCLSCLADGAGEGIYPYDDGKVDNTKPVPKLLPIEAEPADGGPFKLLILCFHCYHRLEGDSGPDMWTTQSAYEALGPQTPFARLPSLRYQRPDGTRGEYVRGAKPIWDLDYYTEGAG